MNTFGMRMAKGSSWIRKPNLTVVIIIALVMGAATHAWAAYDVVISAATSTLGSWSGSNPDIWTPSASGSTVSAADIESRLTAITSVEITTGSSGSEAGDIRVHEALSWSANTLTLSATNTVNINSLLTAGGTAALVITNSGLNVAGRVDFPGRSGMGFLTINGTDYTVISGLGAAGSTTGTDLQGMNGNLSGHYALGSDINASATSGWNSNAGFGQIGTNSIHFTGSFDGLGHTIDRLFIYRPNTDWMGLFGWSTGSLRNVGLTKVHITGKQNSGGLAGVSQGTVISSYATGSVSGLLTVGGLVGYNGGTVSNGYATGSVSGGSSVGGLVGDNIGTVITSYATATVSGAVGAVSVGGLVGWNEVAGTVSNSHWDKDTCIVGIGVGTAAGATGKTTSELRSLVTFSMWDIDDAGGTGKTWRIYDGHTYPLLRNLLKTGPTAAANDDTVIYDGSAYTGGNGVVWSDPSLVSSLLGTSLTYTGSSQGASNAGTYAITPAGYWSDQQGYDIIFASGTLTISKANSTTTVTTSANPSAIGQSVTFTATVTGSGAVPTGMVDFANGGTGLCSGVTMTSGTATCSTSAVIAGDNTITATYSGNGNYNGSAGTTLQSVRVSVRLLSVAKTGTGTGTVTANITGQEGNGISCGADCSETYAEGATISLTATPATGSDFSGWSGGCNGSGQVTMGAEAASCTATFTIEQRTISTTVSAGGGTLSCVPHPVAYGQTSSCTATPGSGFVIGSVSGCGSGSLAGNTYTTGAVTTDCTVTASFAAIVNGTCGSANGQSFMSAPTTSLCTSGTPGSVSGSGPWTWICNSANGGTNANCSAQFMPDGDLTGDGTVDIADALKALRIAAGIDKATTTDLRNGDVAPLVNGVPAPDGSITIGDAVVILRKAVGLVSW